MDQKFPDAQGARSLNLWCWSWHCMCSTCKLCIITRLNQNYMNRFYDWSRQGSFTSRKVTRKTHNMNKINTKIIIFTTTHALSVRLILNNYGKCVLAFSFENCTTVLWAATKPMACSTWTQSSPACMYNCTCWSIHTVLVEVRRGQQCQVDSKQGLQQTVPNTESGQDIINI